MYSFLLDTLLKKQWRKIGTKKRAGVVFPLFSIYSNQSAGIGEIPDLKLAVDWCNITGHTILQTLPLNDTGFLASPFSPQSSTALNPIYLSLSLLKEAEIDQREIRCLKRKFQNKLVDYRVGEEKIKILRSTFDKSSLDKNFEKFITSNDYWINDYALFEALKKEHSQKSWKKWKPLFKEKNKNAIESFKKRNKKEILFWQWIQWQLFEQLKEVKEYANQKGVFLKGDLPLFVSDDSVDCWSNLKYFKMDLSSGAPPDSFSIKGQNWGMPPYNWEKISKDNFNYFLDRFKYAENFYDILRIDHIIGLFRTWSISKEKEFFDPQTEKEQIKKGKDILKLMIENTEMLLCAEDLGTIPLFCRRVLEDLGIPGLDVGRNQKNYRETAVSTLSTHDFNLYPAYLMKRKEEVNGKIIRENLETINRSPCIFNILLIFEWLFLDGVIEKEEVFDYRINDPAKNRLENWSIKMPLSMEKLISHPINKEIRKIIKESGRI